MTLEPSVHGVYLYGLDPEIGIDNETASEAILIESLFSRQVCLNESHVLDNRAVWSFFQKNIEPLKTMLDNLESDEVPLIGLCSRFGSDIASLLDEWLDPEEEVGFPNYLTALTPEQNDALRRKPYPGDKDKRRKRLFKIAPELEQQIQRLTQYFQRDPARTTVLRPSKDTPDRTFYPSVLLEIRELRSNPLVSDEDKRIADSLEEAIARLPIGEVPTREGLHRAIYGAPRVPPIHNGTILSHKGTPPSGEIKHEWRFFINSIYNHNLAKHLHLRPVLNTRWWTVGQRWLPKHPISDKLQINKTRTLPLCTPLYPQHVNLEFATKVRKSRQFRESISALEALRRSRPANRAKQALTDHILFLSKAFENYLEDIGQGHLVGETFKDAAVKMAHKTVDRLALGAGPVLTSLMIYRGIPPGAAFLAWRDLAETGHIAAFLTEAIFSFAPSAVGEKRIRSREFKSVIAELEQGQFL